LARRFAPFNFSYVPDFPNVVPTMDEWGEFLPIFREHRDDNLAEHLLEFHELMQQWEIHHEDVLMKMSMYSLEGDAREWYRSLPPTRISSLKEFHAAFNTHCQRFYSSELICHGCFEKYKDYVQDIVVSYEGCENEEDALDEESTLSLPCSSASNENCVCYLNKESAEIEYVLEADILCNPIPEKPRYEQPIFDSYDGDKIFLSGLNLDKQPVFNNEEQFSHVRQKMPFGMSFKVPPLFDHYGDSDEDVEMFFVLGAESIGSQPSYKSESFYQEQHDKEKDPSIDIHEEIYFHQLEDVIGADQGEVGHQPFTHLCLPQTFNQM
jgi:hypothetical protein